jgi:hypothetical protein
MSAGFAGAAFARGEVATIRLAAPSAGGQVIAINTLWNCEDDTCRARPNHAITVRACRQFLREAGAGTRVIAHGDESRALSGDELARCNGDTLEARND